MMIFWWKQDGKLNAVCYRSMTDVVRSFEAFGITPLELAGIFDGMILEHKNVLRYSGDDYALVFRLEGDTITCGRPPLIKHEYELPLIPHDSSAIIMTSTEPEYHELIEKYYTLYRLSNKKAKQALKDSEFNLNPSDD